MYWRSAPAHIASITSFIVAPAARPTALIRSSGQPCAANRRAPVIGTLNIDFGAWNASAADCSRNASFTAFAAAPPRPTTSFTIRPAARERVGLRRAARLVEHVRPAPAATTAAARRASSGSGDSELWSSRSADTPSSSAWWILLYVANRLPCRPSMTVNSHIGRCRSSNEPCSRDTSSSSSRTRPGRGSPECRTWYSMSSWSSLDHAN